MLLVANSKPPLVRRVIEHRAAVLNHPAVRRLRGIAIALGQLAPEVVFIGGAIAPLLQEEPPFAAARQTKDVDGVVVSTSYSDVDKLHEKLRTAGFHQTPEDAGHIHRWRSPDGELFDLVPSGEHPGGSGQIWDKIAIDSHEVAHLGGGVRVRHASACAFLGLKWAAHEDRGREDPFNSHDLEDVLALVASRPTIVDEVAQAGVVLRVYLVERVVELLAHPQVKDLVAGALNNADDKSHAIGTVSARLQSISKL